MADFFVENPSFFEDFDVAADQDLKSLQLAPGQPDVAEGIFTASDPIVPDKVTADRLGHFDPEIYDLRDSSHLMKLLKILLGGAGVGGLRKQLAVARMQNAFNGMHFLDLDRFYGALFGIKRTKTELIPSFSWSPYTDAATPAEWDDLHSKDASYRDRLIKFARSIPYGGSYMGIRMMCEALIAAECEVYESWNWIDEQDAGRFQASVLTYTWGFLADNVKTYGALAEKTWGDWSGQGQLFQGRTNTRLRSEWMLLPKRPLSVDEEYEIVRVLNVFKPAGTSFTVAATGLNIHIPMEIRDVSASSEHWEIISSTTVNPNLNFNPYANSLTGVAEQPVYPQARPAFSGYQGEEWSLNGDVITVASYSMDEEGAITTGNNELVPFADGTAGVYQASDGVMTVAQATAARLIGDGVMTSLSYAPARSSFNPNTVVAAVTA